MLPAFLVPASSSGVDPRSGRLRRRLRRWRLPETWRRRIRRLARHPVMHWLLIGSVAVISGLTVLRVTTRAERAATGAE